MEREVHGDGAQEFVARVRASSARGVAGAVGNGQWPLGTGQWLLFDSWEKWEAAAFELRILHFHVIWHGFCYDFLTGLIKNPTN
jgi:hypothetical protein